VSDERDLRVRPGLVIPAAELRETASRSRGPGGQNVNKTSTRVTLRWNLDASACVTESQRRRLRERLGARLTRGGDLVLHSDRTRSLARNREDARQRLVEILLAALARPRPRRATRPTAASRARRLDAKTRRGVVKRTRRPVAPDRD